MVEVGGKGIVFGAGGDFAQFIPVGTPEVGDTVALYNLVDESRIAVPTLTFSIGDQVWNTPSFDFAGFNFSLDFNFQLIPFVGFVISETAKLLIEHNWRAAGYIGEVMETVYNNVFWDGAGRVWLSRSGVSVESIQFDDQLRFTGGAGSTEWLQGPPIIVPPGGGGIQNIIVEVTGFLNPGLNNISIEIRDTAGGMIGPYADIWIIQTIP